MGHIGPYANFTVRDRSMRSGTELAREMSNLSNRSSGVQIPRDVCTRLKRYLYSAKCSWIIKFVIGQFVIGQFVIGRISY